MNTLRVPIEHSGNQNASYEEAEAVRDLFESILASGSKWTDREGVKKVVSKDDILMVTPYNAQVFELQQLLPGAWIGTVAPRPKVAYCDLLIGHFEPHGCT